MIDILKSSIECCIAFDNKKLYFYRGIFAFTTENISGYIKNFHLKDKSLLTVGSSADQVINAALHGCKDITLYDIIPEAKYYYYLKVAGLLSLTKDEFLEFFRFKNYNNSLENPNVFNMKSFNKIKVLLKSLSNEAYLYYDELFKNFSNITIRKALFSPCEYNTDRIILFNDYLKSDILYEEASSKIKKINPKFICDDILEIDNKDTYDNIWLSNIATWLRSEKEIDKLLTKSYECLNERGRLLLSYLYTTTSKLEYDPSFAPIYDINTILKKYKDYNLSLIEFDGVKSDSTHIEEQKDSILLLKK